MGRGRKKKGSTKRMRSTKRGRRKRRKRRKMVREQAHFHFSGVAITEQANKKEKERRHGSNAALSAVWFSSDFFPAVFGVRSRL